MNYVENQLITVLQESAKDHESRLRTIEASTVRQTEILGTLKDIMREMQHEGRLFDKRIAKNERLLYVILGVAISIEFFGNVADKIKAFLS